MPHAPWHGGGTYTGANVNFNPNKGYTTSSSQQNNSNYNASQDLNQAMIQSALDRINQTVAMKDQPGGLSTTALNPNVQFGAKTGKYNYIRDKMLAGQPLTPGEQVFADFYTGNLGGAGTAAGLTEYSGAMQDFKTGTPEEQAAFKIRFPNPIAKVFGGIGDYIMNATFLGKGLQALESGANKAKDFVGGLFPGDNTQLNNLMSDFASVPGGATQDAVQMFKDLTPKDAVQMFKDLTPGVGEVREELGVKKQTANDIVETAFSDETMEAMSAGDPVNFVGDTKGLFLTTPQGAIPATISNLSATQDPFLNPSLPFSEQTYPYYQQTLKKLGLTK